MNIEIRIYICMIYMHSYSCIKFQNYSSIFGSLQYLKYFFYRAISGELKGIFIFQKHIIILDMYMYLCTTYCADMLIFGSSVFFCKVYVCNCSYTPYWKESTQRSKYDSNKQHSFFLKSEHVKISSTVLIPPYKVLQRRDHEYMNYSGAIYFLEDA
jgi:hypothetical protein